jgi:NAD(P)-dependent dehydrogenase (short-subunit alcohol dehydrogenase family)
MAGLVPAIHGNRRKDVDARVKPAHDVSIVKESIVTGLLDGRLALITGAGSGIGEAIAHAMADAGTRVVAVDMDGGAAERTATAIGRAAASFACDVADRVGCDRLAVEIRNRTGAISILVNNAGIIRRGTMMEPHTRTDWDATLAVNLDGPYNMVTAFLHQLRETKGSIINIGSIQSFVALPNSAAYTTSKGGVRLLTKALAIELSPHGIRVNAIGPGFTATRLNAKAREDPAYMANFASRIPLGRIGTPEDIAGPAVFLASDMARYITGVTLPVDGGYLAR